MRNLLRTGALALATTAALAVPVTASAGPLVVESDRGTDVRCLGGVTEGYEVEVFAIDSAANGQFAGLAVLGPGLVPVAIGEAPAAWAGTGFTATIPLQDLDGAPQGKAIITGTYTAGEAETVSDRWKDGNGHVSATQTLTPLDVTLDVRIDGYTWDGAACDGVIYDFTSRSSDPRSTVMQDRRQAHVTQSEACELRGFAGHIEFGGTLRELAVYAKGDAGPSGFGMATRDGGTMEWYDETGEPLGEHPLSLQLERGVPTHDRFALPGFAEFTTIYPYVAHFSIELPGGAVAGGSCELAFARSTTKIGPQG